MPSALPAPHPNNIKRFIEDNLKNLFEYLELLEEKTWHDIAFSVGTSPSALSPIADFLSALQVFVDSTYNTSGTTTKESALFLEAFARFAEYTLTSFVEYSDETRTNYLSSLAKVKTAHTKLRNKLKSEETSLPLECAAWEKTKLQAVQLWNNLVNLRDDIC